MRSLIMRLASSESFRCKAHWREGKTVLINFYLPIKFAWYYNYQEKKTIKKLLIKVVNYETQDKILR